jgi:hypothetical protein
MRLERMDRHQRSARERGPRKPAIAHAAASRKWSAAARTRYASGVLRALTALLVLLASSRVHAQERLSLVWRAPRTESCPDEAAVRAEVERLVGGAIPNDGPPIRAEARAERAGREIVLHLRTEIEGVADERTLRSAQCVELASAAALLVALLIDPEAAFRAEEPPVRRAPRSEIRAELDRGTLASLSPEARNLIMVRPEGLPRTDALGTRDPEAPREDDSLRGFVGAAGLLDVGSLPSPTAGIAIDGGIGIPLVDARVRAVFLFPQTASLSAPFAVEAELYGFSAGVMGCLRPIDVARFIGICADVQAGAIFGRTSHITDPQFGGGFWLAAGGGLVGVWRALDWLDFELTAEVLGLLVPLDFAVATSEEPEEDVVIFDPVDVSARFALAVHVHF